jgi:hypothetical protein
MRDIVRSCIFLFAAALLAATAVTSVAQEGRPPGWRGWTPQKQVAWGEEFDKGLARVMERAGKAEDFTDSDKVLVERSFRAMATSGVPIAEARTLVERLLDRGLKGKEIDSVTRTMSYGFGEGLKAGRINAYIRDRLNEGLRGEELTAEIRRAIDRRLTP